MNNIQLQILQNPSALNDPSCQRQVMAFLDGLRSSSVGWQMCIEALSNEEIQDDRLKFLGLQVIEAYLKGNYCKASVPEQQIVRRFLSRWIQIMCAQHDPCLPVFVRNKAAQVFALACVQDFPHRWPTFFNDLIDTLTLGPQAVDNFLRVLKAVDSEIADREMSYTQIQIQRNTLIKNAMRESCVEPLVKSLYGILTNYDLSNPELTSHCLEVLATYIHWIDIGLVANDHFINILLRLLAMPTTREAAAVCVHSIIAKGMDPTEKFRLVESLISVLNNVGVFNVSREDDSEFCTKLSHLVNGIGLAILDSFTKLQKGGLTEQLTMIEIAVDDKVPIMVNFLGNDYDDVSGAVLEFAKDYVHFLKGRPALSEQQLKNAHQLMVTVIHKMKYDVSYQFEHEGEDEVEFLEFRKLLKIVFDNLVGLNKNMVLTYIRELITYNVMEWRTMPFSDVEVSLAALYYIGEVLPVQGGNYLPEDNAHLLAMMHMVLDSGVSSHPHLSVALQFLEVTVRYERLLLTDTQRLLSVLFIFMDTCGMRHPSAKVRSRSAYLFCKFIKGSKSVIQTCTKDILVPLQDLLVINNPSNGDKLEWMSQDDQLFLFEAAAILIVSSSLGNQEKATAFRDLLLPVLKKFDSLLKDITNETDAHRQERYANCMAHTVVITTRTSKAFTQQTSMRSVDCVTLYIECLEVFIACLQGPIHSTALQNSVRQFLHRMVVCIDSELLPYIPRASQGLLKNNDIRSMQEYIPLLIQIIGKFKKAVIPFLQECLTPIVSALFQTIAAPLEEGDEDGRVEKISLKRQYFQFISTVVTHVPEALNGQHSIVLKEILGTVAQGAAETEDPVMQKSCFGILRKLIELWGGRDSSDEFIQFLLQNVIQICFEAPVNHSENATERISQAILNESALCLKAIHSKRGDEMINYLKGTYLPNIQVSPQRIEELVYALKSDIKTFKTFLKGFYMLNS